MLFINLFSFSSFYSLSYIYYRIESIFDINRELDGVEGSLYLYMKERTQNPLLEMTATETTLNISSHSGEAVVVVDQPPISPPIQFPSVVYQYYSRTQRERREGKTIERFNGDHQNSSLSLSS